MNRNAKILVFGLLLLKLAQSVIDNDCWLVNCLEFVFQFEFIIESFTDTDCLNKALSFVPSSLFEINLFKLLIESVGFHRQLPSFTHFNLKFKLK